LSIAVPTPLLTFLQGLDALGRLLLSFALGCGNGSVVRGAVVQMVTVPGGTQRDQRLRARKLQHCDSKSTANTQYMVIGGSLPLTTDTDQSYPSPRRRFVSRVQLDLSDGELAVGGV